MRRAAIYFAAYTTYLAGCSAGAEPLHDLEQKVDPSATDERDDSSNSFGSNPFAVGTDAPSPAAGTDAPSPTADGDVLHSFMVGTFWVSIQDIRQGYLNERVVEERVVNKATEEIQKEVNESCYKMWQAILDVAERVGEDADFDSLYFSRVNSTGGIHFVVPKGSALNTKVAQAKYECHLSVEKAESHLFWDFLNRYKFSIAEEIRRAFLD